MEEGSILDGYDTEEDEDVDAVEEREALEKSIAEETHFRFDEVELRKLYEALGSYPAELSACLSILLRLTIRRSPQTGKFIKDVVYAGPPQAEDKQNGGSSSA